MLHGAPAAAQAWRDVAPQPAPQAPRAAPAQPSAPAPADAGRIAVERLAGLVFEAAGTSATSATASAAAPTPQQRIVADALPVLDAAFLQQFAADLDRPLSFGRLAEIRRAVIEHYRAAGQPLVDVYVPEQDVSAGVVRIDVAQFKLGRIRASGNRYFSSALLEREMPLAAGAPIPQSDVSLGLAVLNANPYRRVDAVFAPGDAPNTTDVLLQTEDRLPLRANLGYDNAGVPDLGRNRFFAGLGYGNLFGLDQQIAYQFTASDDIFSGNPETAGHSNRTRFTAHALSYTAPLPWLDSIELFGVYAQSAPRLPDAYGQTGISAQLSFRYDLRLPGITDTTQLLQLGYDYKRSNNDLEFGGFQVFNSNTHIHQFLLTYDISKPTATGTAHASATLVASPGAFDRDNRDAAFNAARQGATARYTYLQLSAAGGVALGAGFTLSANGVFQWTPNTLLPSEEMGLGGESSVRGYDPYVVLGDRGWNLQTELRAPAIAFGASDAVVQPFVFFDAGHVWNRIDQPAENNPGLLAGVGAGLRFRWSRHVDLRCTYGAPLRAPSPGGSKSPTVLVYLSIGT
ncbi:BamA/TamA family outer membrane protein [Paraburkholderia sp. MMS20-SJTR3]|uniref:BamA/TamA family outer membrane protein n=1 Tax=Paraburkholderia sejongensis TaxID=2886946 RepID=A0ABS8JRL3_9BURK|nr:ShlB/FhaC/HecB family hemolysin secretion/activation protein [Paraburkholderia sp. MMS20-SJTR3]MCC8392472.1 BamA/TamA family outer membrane protein [Paraburkholderia sp. MMS20-SJTR3]